MHKGDQNKKNAKNVGDVCFDALPLHFEMDGSENVCH